MSGRKEWMPATHDPILLRYWENPIISVEQIAENMGFSVKTIRVKAKDLSLPMRKPLVCEKNPKPPKERISPISAAFAVLPGLKERNGAYWLNGRPVNLKQIMQATNRARIAAKPLQEQIDINPEWRV